MRLLPLLIVLPLLEIILFITINNIFGIIFVLSLTVFSALFGLSLVRWKFQNKLKKPNGGLNDLNVKNLSDSFFILVSGIFFITPGFLTDLFGLCLLNSKFRSFIKRFIVYRVLEIYGFNNNRRKKAKPHIDGDYEELNN